MRQKPKKHPVSRLLDAYWRGVEDRRAKRDVQPPKNPEEKKAYLNGYYNR